MTTLLLIDDDLDCARLVRKVLSGYVVEHAATGLAGLQLARKTPADLILVDINLPDLSGNVVMNQLKGTARQPCIPIVAFTAETADKAKRVARMFGCTGFLSKPINPRTFPAQIEEILTRQRGG